MKKAAIRLAILSVILFVSTSGIVLGAVYDNTNVSTENSTTVTSNTTNVTEQQTVSDVKSNTTNLTEEQSAADNANVTATDSGIEETVEATPEGIADTIPAPEETSVPLPVQTPKSPGFESVGAVALLLLAMYVSKRK
jgi:hypothetical protein